MTEFESDIVITASSIEVSNFQDGLFPTEYPYTIVEFEGSANEFQATLNIDMNTVDDVDLWRTKFEARTKTTYTIRTSSVKNGKQYNAIMRYQCHRNTRGRTTTKEKANSRNTECPANIVMKLHRKKPLGKHHLCVATIDFNHNHPIHGADALRFKKPSKEIEQKYLELFANGHKPSAAIRAYLTGLLLAHPDNYEELVGDRSVNPDYQWVFRLHSKFRQEGGGTASGETSTVEVVDGAEKDRTEYIIIQEVGSEFTLDDIAQVVQSNADGAPPSGEHILLCTDQPTEANEEIDDGHLSLLNEILQDVSTRLQDQPEIYGPALEAFHTSYFKISTDAARISAFHTFAKESGVKFVKSPVLPAEKTGAAAVDSTAVSLRQPAVLARRQLGFKRSLKDHTYGSAETRTVGKRNAAAEHDSSECVAAQVGTTDGEITPNPETTASSSDVGNENARKKGRSRVVTGYNMFFKELHEQHEGGKTWESFRTIAKSASEKWRSLSPTSKQRYTEAASPLNTAMESTMNSDKSKEHRFQCTKCSKRFMHFHHFRSHSGECGMSHACGSCAKSFNSRANLLKHVSHVHGKKKKAHQCEQCKKCYYSRWDLEVHSRVHNGERPFACKVCNKKFYVKSNKNRHEKLHAND